MSIAVLPAADHDDVAADRQARLVVRLAQRRDVVHRVQHALEVLVLAGTQAVDALHPDAEEHGVEVAAQVGQVEVAAELDPVADLDPAHAEDELDLALRELVRNLVGGDAVLVQPADLARRSSTTTSCPAAPARARRRARPGRRPRRRRACPSAPSARRAGSPARTPSPWRGAGGGRS
jgi:hypothetical protein